MLHKRSANLAHHRLVPKPTIFHQIHTDVVMAAAGEDGCRDDAGTTPPHRITEAR